MQNKQCPFTGRACMDNCALLMQEDDNNQVCAIAMQAHETFLLTDVIMHMLHPEEERHNGDKS